MRIPLLSLAVLSFVASLAGPSWGDEPTRWPISVEGKWGYIDIEGTIKIQPQYGKADYFRNGRALVSVFRDPENSFLDRTYDGFIAESGKFVIPAERPGFLESLGDFEKYQYESFHPEQGVAVVIGSERSRGLIDRTGKLVVPLRYGRLGSFAEGLCFAEELESGRTSYINFQGESVVQPKGLLYGSRFSEGRAKVTVRTDQGDFPVLIDRGGNEVIGPGRYTAIGSVHGGLARVVGDGEVGLVDRDGMVVVPLGKYEQILEPESGVGFIAQRGDAFFVIRAGHDDRRLENHDWVPEGFDGEYIVVWRGDKTGYATDTGRVVVPPIYDEISSYEGALARFRDGDTHGYLNRAGKVVWSTQKWPLPLQYSLRQPLTNYLPDFATKAMPLSYNWDVQNAVVFVCDGKLAKLREWLVAKRSNSVKVEDYTDFDLQPHKLDFSLSTNDGYLELFAMAGDEETKASEDTDGFVRFYACENMDQLRKQFPNKTIGILLQN